MLTAGPVAGSCKKRRRSQHITPRQANNLVAASAYAEDIGCRLNVSIDVFWLMFSGWEEDAKRLAKSQQRLSKWFARRGFTLVMIWVREIGANGALHTHILLHVPPWLMESGEFQFVFERSLEPEGGGHSRESHPHQACSRPRREAALHAKRYQQAWREEI